MVRKRQAGARPQKRLCLFLCHKKCQSLFALREISKVLFAICPAKFHQRFYLPPQNISKILFSTRVHIKSSIFNSSPCQANFILPVYLTLFRTMTNDCDHMYCLLGSKMIAQLDYPEIRNLLLAAIHFFASSTPNAYIHTYIHSIIPINLALR
jgi:hypothetical protein